MEYKTLKLLDAQIKFADDKPTFTGYASVFGGNDDYNDTIHPGAFTKALATSAEVKMYFNHGWLRRELPIGKMHLKQDSRGLLVESAEFTEGLKAAEDVARAVRHGTVDGLSIGFGVEPSGVKRKANGGKDIFEIKYLKEVSVVDFPADESARIADVKSALDECATLKEIETLLREAGGFSRADATSLVGRIKSLAHGERDAEMKAALEMRALFANFRT